MVVRDGECFWDSALPSQERVADRQFLMIPPKSTSIVNSIE
jgi:hypothetical protein